MRREARRTPLLFIDRDGAKQDSGRQRDGVGAREAIQRDIFESAEGLAGMLRAREEAPACALPAASRHSAAPGCEKA